jgi:hypothetical protein
MPGIGDAIGGFAGGLAQGIKDREDEGKGGGSFGDKFSRFKSLFKRSAPAASDEDNESSTSLHLRKGGRIKKTGRYHVEKGEVVVPAKLAKEIGSRLKVRKSSRKSRRGSGRR